MFPRNDINKRIRKVADSVNNNNKNTSSRNDNNKKKRKVVDSVNNENRTLIIGFLNRGKTCLLNHILFRKQEPAFINTKSLNQYLNVKAKTSVEFQTLNE